MSEGASRLTRRADYRPADYALEQVHLSLDLDAEHTVVRSRLRLRNVVPGAPLVLDGIDLGDFDIRLDGRSIPAAAIDYDGKRLVLPPAGGAVLFEATTHVYPSANHSGLGLMTSRDGAIFSQCEAEGFRRITFFPDRPDILAPFEIELTASRAAFPVLLASGSLSGTEDLPDGRHSARWSLTTATPCYVVALLAGCFAEQHRSHKTGDRIVDLGLYTAPDDAASCAPVLDFVARAMDWDQATFGRVYDLDIFNVGVLNGFPGAMENKALNLFDLNWAAADPASATDAEYEYRLKTVGHEYLHNWSGNIVTCRTWFDLTFKEGLTRFRDQLFIGDLTDMPSVRIAMRRHLETSQFAEDDSPAVHPVVWDEYLEPRNLYTSTVYDKGQEILFMLAALHGRDPLCNAIAAVLDELAGSAVTADAFLQAVGDQLGDDLAQFGRWYHQPGTAMIVLSIRHDPVTETARLRVRQSIKQIGIERLGPLRIPLAIGLLGEDGFPIPVRLDGEAESCALTRVLDITCDEQEFVLTGLPLPPIVSPLRGASALVIVQEEATEAELAVRARFDPDGFARWRAGQTYASKIISHGLDMEAVLPLDTKFADAFLAAVNAPGLSERLRVELLTLPTDRAIGDGMPLIRVRDAHRAVSVLTQQLARHGLDAITEAMAALGKAQRTMTSEAIGVRKLRNHLLRMLVSSGERDAAMLAFEVATARDGLFSDRCAALDMLCTAQSESGVRNEALAACHRDWADRQLALDKWYLAQARMTSPDTPERMRALMNEDAFGLTMVSRVYSTAIAYFSENRAGLHTPAGHDVFYEQLLRIDGVLPIVSARVLATSDFMRWRRFDEPVAASMQQTLAKFAATPSLSASVHDLVQRALRTDGGDAT